MADIWQLFKVPFLRMNHFYRELGIPYIELKLRNFIDFIFYLWIEQANT